MASPFLIHSGKVSHLYGSLKAVRHRNQRVRSNQLALPRLKIRKITPKNRASNNIAPKTGPAYLCQYPIFVCSRVYLIHQESSSLPKEIFSPFNPAKLKCETKYPAPFFPLRKDSARRHLRYFPLFADIQTMKTASNSNNSTYCAPENGSASCIFAKTNLGKPPSSAKIQSARNWLPLSAFAFILAGEFLVIN